MDRRFRSWVVCVTLDFFSSDATCALSADKHLDLYLKLHGNERRKMSKHALQVGLSVGLIRSYES